MPVHSDLYHLGEESQILSLRTKKRELLFTNVASKFVTRHDVLTLPC